MTPYQHMFSILDYRIVSYFTETCIELNVFDRLATSALPISQLAKYTNTHERALYRCLRGLAHFGLVIEEDGMVFSLTDTSHYITEDSQYSLRAWHQFCQLAQSSGHKKRLSLWKELLCTGKSIYQIGRHKLFYDYLRENQKLAAVFDKAMESMSKAEVHDIVKHIDFSFSDHVTEIAGGSGMLIKGILEKYAKIKGQLCDFPDVVKRIATEKRLTLSGSNMHQSLPTIAGDAIIKRVLHSYCDAKANNILHQIYKSMQPGKKLYVFELIEDCDVLHPYTGIKHLQMLLAHGAPGKCGGPGERTQKEFISLLASSGFEFVESAKMPCIDAVIALRK